MLRKKVLSGASSSKWRSANARIPSHRASSEVETSITRTFSAGCYASARAIAEQPAENVRVMLVSTSEEALCEGMRAFVERHFEELAPERTFVLSIDTVGSPHLLVL